MSEFSSDSNLPFPRPNPSHPKFDVEPSSFAVHLTGVNTHPVPPRLQGRLLLADPTLRDGSFNKSVILLADHTPDEGAFGLILNHPSGQKVGNLISGPEFKHLAKLDVHFGGPVSRDQLTFAAFYKRNSKFGFATRISADEAGAYMNQPDTLVRAFAGYTGWSKNQLEDEIEQESWTIVDPESDLIARQHDVTLWKRIMSGISPFHRIIANAPDEILAN